MIHFGHVIHLPGTCLSTFHAFYFAYELPADNGQSQINFLLANRSHNYMRGLVFPNRTAQIMSDADCMYDNTLRYINIYTAKIFISTRIRSIFLEPLRMQFYSK